MGNRHGDHGCHRHWQTVTLQALAQGFSRLGVPVFWPTSRATAGISQAGQPTDKLKARLQELQLPEPAWGACPATLWDVFGEKGHRCGPR